MTDAHTVGKEGIRRDAEGNWFDEDGVEYDEDGNEYIYACPQCKQNKSLQAVHEGFFDMTGTGEWDLFTNDPQMEIPPNGYMKCKECDFTGIVDDFDGTNTVFTVTETTWKIEDHKSWRELEGVVFPQVSIPLCAQEDEIREIVADALRERHLLRPLGNCYATRVTDRLIVIRDFKHQLPRFYLKSFFNPDLRQCKTCGTIGHSGTCDKCGMRVLGEYEGPQGILQVRPGCYGSVLPGSDEPFFTIHLEENPDVTELLNRYMTSWRLGHLPSHHNYEVSLSGETIEIRSALTYSLITRLVPERSLSLK